MTPKDRNERINELADFIRLVDGDHTMGTGEMAERIVDEGFFDANLHQEVVWDTTPDSLPMPELHSADGQFFLDAQHTKPFEPTDEAMRARGWVKRQRWVSDWEDVQP